MKGKCKQSIFIEELIPEACFCSRSTHMSLCEGTQEDRKWCSYWNKGGNDE